MPDIPGTHGYRSLLFLSQQKYLNKMIEKIGIDRTLGRDYLYETCLPNWARHLPARPAVVRHNAQRIGGTADAPFFSAAYNFQTHTFLDG